MTHRRYRLDPATERHGAVIIGGSPVRMFRLTPAGVGVVDAIATGRSVAPSRLVEALLAAGAIHPEPGVTGRYGVDDVTVVTPAFGPPRHLRPGAVLVDDGSQPPLADAAVRLPTNRGPGAARNAGLATVSTALVAFVDTDVRCFDGDGVSDGGWLGPLLPHFDDDRVAAVAPRVASTSGPGSLARYEERNSPLDLGPTPARVEPGTRVGYVPAAAIVCRVDALRAIGGFDDSLRFGEDVDLVWRLLDHGWRVRYEPSSVVHHDPRRSWRSWIAQRAEYGSSAAPLAARHGDAVAPVRTSGWSIATWLVVVGGHPLLGAGVVAGTGAALAHRLPALPAWVSLRLTVRGHLHAGRQLSEAVRRAWWPLLSLVAIRSPMARR
ncbi:MAG: mycofactocin system glycosyltransferase, partial [Ilumatobacter sp.]|nr:mycofactocin system glycosyltransferase [Ilumatobacter sp.]